MRKTLMPLMVVMLMIPSIAVAAQPAEPVGTVTSGNNEVFRAYDNPTVDMDALAGVLAFGSVYDDETTAASEFGSTDESLVESLRGGLSGDNQGGDYEFGELEAVEIGQIGDESSASLLPFTAFGTIDGEYGVVVARQGAWVQALVGFGVGEVDVVAELEAIAMTLEGRWPSDNPIVARDDGLRAGGIWDMMPLPQDLPDGFVIDEAFEEGPAASGASTSEVDEIEAEATPAGEEAPLVALPAEGEATPAASPVVAATPIAGIGEPIDQDSMASPVTTEDTGSSVEPARSPTPTPEPIGAVTPSPGPSPEPVDTTLDEPASPGDMNPRLAPPFDLLIDIIIAQGNYTPNANGSCSGSGVARSLAPGGDLSVQDSFGNELAAASIEDTGRLNYDTVLTEDVCYWRVTLPNVTAREEYVLVTGGSVIGQFRYEDLATGEPGLVVIGAEDD